MRRIFLIHVNTYIGFYLYHFVLFNIFFNGNFENCFNYSKKFSIKNYLVRLNENEIDYCEFLKITRIHTI